MRTSYLIRYTWQDLWHSSNRPFSLMNLLAITISITTLFLLAGGILAFQQNKEKSMDKMGLRIEVTAHVKRSVSDEQRSQLTKITDASTHWWTPIYFIFYDKDGREYPSGIGGRTVDLDDPLLKSIKDVRNEQSINLLDKEEIKNAQFDELGIIVPFLMLKQLKYLPQTANENQPETWVDVKTNKKVDFPKALQVRVQGTDNTISDISLLIVGVVADFEEARYLMTKDCYHLFALNWQKKYASFAIDRNGDYLIPETKASQIERPELQFFPDTHASTYVENRELLIPVIQKIRELGLKADSGLEHHLKEYKQLESFFIVSASGICLALFLFSGVILFATFYALVLRKNREIGILKAYGTSSSLIQRIFAVEAATLGAMGIAFGAIISYLVGDNISHYVQGLLGSKEQWFITNVGFTIGVFIGGIIFCLFVTFIPVRMAASVDPDQVIRGS